MKKAIILSFVCLFCLSFVASAQDIIFKKDGSKEEAKITLVTDKEIQYRKFSNQDGPVYSINKKDILVINYENGEYETFNTQENEEKPVKVDLTKDFARNIISYHMFDLIFGDFTISYERIFASGRVGIKIPVAVGYDSDGDSYDFTNVVYSGIGVNFYPTGIGKWRYFLGPQIRIGYAKDVDWEYYYDGYNYIEDYVTEEGIYSKFFIDNGVMYMPVRNFSISAIASMGIRYFPQAIYNDDVIQPDGHFAVNISYRF